MSFGEVKSRKPNLRLVIPPPTLQELRDLALIYIATPYTSHPDGMEAAHYQTCALVAKLHVQKVWGAYSPILHFHDVAYYANLPTDANHWKDENEHKLRVASAILIGKLAGWDKSEGIQSEVEYAMAWKKRIYLICPDTLELELRS